MAKNTKICCDTCDAEVSAKTCSTILYRSGMFDLPEGWSFFDCNSLYDLIGESRIELCDKCLEDLKKWFKGAQ